MKIKHLWKNMALMSFIACYRKYYWQKAHFPERSWHLHKNIKKNMNLGMLVRKENKALNYGRVG